MAKNQETGKLGEDLAVQFLEQQGYRIAARNYRAGRGEIDIIAWAEPQVLVFIEVKTRQSSAFGGPEEAIHAKKQSLIARTAGAYMESIDYQWAIRFDTIAVLLRPRAAPEIRHYEDAFFP